MVMVRIALIHATPLAMPPVVGASQRLWSGADVCNLLDDTLYADLRRSGGLDGAMMDRFRWLSRYTANCGAASIPFTYSAFGPCIEAAAEDLKPMPVLKPN